MSFYNSIEKLESRINDLEDEIKKIKFNEETTNNQGIKVYNKSFLNFQILDKKTINLVCLENSISINNFFQLKIKFQNFFKQSIQFKLFADDLLISLQTEKYDSGIFETTLFGTFQNNTLESINLKLQIIANDKKQINLINTNLITYNSSNNSQEEYDASFTDELLFLSYIDNNQLYYKIFNLIEDSENYEFIPLTNAISHSTCAFNNQFYIFRIDESSNLFFNNISNNDEIFIASNAEKVSCCKKNNSIIYCYISNGNVYYGEIINNVVISNKQITFLKGDISSCHISYNQFSNKCYLLLTKKDTSNYLLESLPETYKSSENICANITLQITTM